MSTLQIMPQSIDDCKNKHVYNFVAHKLNHFTILKNLYHISFPYYEKVGHVKGEIIFYFRYIGRK